MKVRRSLKVFVLFLSLPFTFSAQVYINELSSVNDTVVKDGDGDYPDWLELYNAGNTAVGLENYSLTVKDQNTIKTWSFPKCFIQPKKHLGIFASGKDRKTILDHWEVPVYVQNPWKYFVGLYEPPANWRQLNFNDAGWANGVGPIGYGYPGLPTVIAQTRSLYMRKTFTVADTSRIALGALYLTCDDGFVAYLNDVEIARFNVGIAGDHPSYNTYAYDPFPAVQPLIFLIPKNALKQGQNVFCMQTHNAQIAMNNLLAYPFVLLGTADSTELIQPSIPINEIQLHTSFTLPSEGERVILKNPAGAVVDQVDMMPMHTNHSYGRNTDGGAAFCYFDRPTPNDTNNTSVCYSGYSKKPVLSLKSGFYNGNPSLSISAYPASGNIRYTKDGSAPTLTSALYTGPVTLDSTRVIKARSFEGSGKLPSEITAGTYFLNEKFSLPVLSVSTDPKDLWDYNSGIYVNGPGADTVWPHLGANFWKGWSRRGHVMYFDKHGNYGFDLHCPLEIQGNYSKGFPQKGFTVKSKDDFNEEKIDYPLFGSKPHIKSYARFNIRNMGSDWNTAHMRDRFVHNLVKRTNVDYMAGEPCIMFLNGQYWGVYELREKQDGDYLEENHNVDKRYIDLLRFNGEAMEGTNKAFLDMIDFFENNNMSLQQNYDSARAMIDMDNLTDYFITETYVANFDWIYPEYGYANNIKFWRCTQPKRKWRYILWDTDVSLGLVPLAANYNTNVLKAIITPSVANPHSAIFGGLLKNTGFRNQFVNRYADLLNTTLHPKNFNALLYKMRNEMEPEMTRHFGKWSEPITFSGFALGSSTSVATWKKAVDSIAVFGNYRVDIVRSHIQSEFGLPQQVKLDLNTFPDNGGAIKLNTIYPDSFPWSGIYFESVPVSMTAVPKPGYKFLYWRCNKHKVADTNANITVNLTQADEFTAHFQLVDYSVNVYPNPSSGAMRVYYQIPGEHQASIKVYNMLGQHVATLVSENRKHAEGEFYIDFDPKSYAMNIGVYLLTLRTDDFVKTVRIVVSY